MVVRSKVVRLSQSLLQLELGQGARTLSPHKCAS